MPKKDELKRLSIWIDAMTLKKLKQVATEQDRPVGWVIRQELKKLMDNK